VGREDQLVGRALELAMLAELVEYAAAGRGWVVLLTWVATLNHRHRL
jgi:hypothetical protein